MLVNMLGTTKIRANLHIAGRVPFDQSQGQALVEQLLLPTVTSCINKFLCKAARERGGELPHTPVVLITTG